MVGSMLAEVRVPVGRSDSEVKALPRDAGTIGTVTGLGDYRRESALCTRAAKN
jgi:hypothetical protein